MVVGVSHIYAVLYPFFVFTAVKLAPLLLGPGVRASIGLPRILKFPCKRTGIFSIISGRSLGCADSWVAGDLLFPYTFLLIGRGQTEQNLVFGRRPDCPTLR